MHWVTPFVGWPYALGAQGPDEWDCFAFFRAVQRQHYGREVPFVSLPVSWGGVAKAIAAGADQFGWRVVTKPRDGDAVMLANMREPTHLGVWIGDLKATLHCAIGGSVLHDARHLAAAQWRIRGYFTPGD